MNAFDEIVGISEQILDYYLEIAYYLTKDKKNEPDFLKRLDELKDLLMIEELAYEKFIMENDREVVYEIALKTEFKGKDELNNMIDERIGAKMHKMLFCTSEVTKVTMDSLKKQINSSDAGIHNLKNFVSKRASQIEFVFNEPNAEMLRNYITFIKIEIEKEENFDIKKRLAAALIIEIYKNVYIEEELVKKQFQIDSDWIRINNVLGLTEEELIEYKQNLINFSRNELENTLDDAYSIQWVESEKSDFLALLLKCKIRSILYSLENRFLEDIETNIISIADQYQKENPKSTQIIKEALLEAKEDRKKYPKLLIPYEKTKIEQIETKIYNLYQTLIELEIRRYKGEEVDFDIENVILILKVKKKEEIDIFKEELLHKLKTNPLTGIETMSFCFDNIIPNIANRTVNIVEKLKHYAILKKQGASEKKANLFIKSPTFMEVYKNILFFFDDAIEKADQSDKDYLIKSKFDYIFENIDLEEIVLENNFQVSKDDLIFPNIFFEKRHINRLNEIIIEIINKELNILLNKELLGDEDLNRQVQKTIIFLRGCFYTLEYKEYEEIILELENILSVFEESIGKENFAATRLAIESAMKISQNDRDKYPKLIFLNDK